MTPRRRRTRYSVPCAANRSNFEGSDSKYAVSFNINKSVFARMKSGETERLMNDTNWISIARRMGVQLGNEPDWLTADTAVYLVHNRAITTVPDGKPSPAFIVMWLALARATRPAVCKAQQERRVCRLQPGKEQAEAYPLHFSCLFGLDHNGKYSEVYENLVYYLKVIHKPLIILDEAGDLDYPAFLELKALWNATEHPLRLVYDGRRQGKDWSRH